MARAPHRGRGPADVLAPIRRAVAAEAGARAGRVRAVSVAAAATVRDGSVVQSSVLDLKLRRCSSTRVAVSK